MICCIHLVMFHTIVGHTILVMIRDYCTSLLALKHPVSVAVKIAFLTWMKVECIALSAKETVGRARLNTTGIAPAANDALIALTCVGCTPSMRISAMTATKQKLGIAIIAAISGIVATSSMTVKQKKTYVPGAENN